MRPTAVALASVVAAWTVLGTFAYTATAGAAATSTPEPVAPAKDKKTADHEPDGFWTGPVNDPVPATIKGGKVIHTQDLAALLKKKGTDAVVVDVSNAPRKPDNLPPTTTWLPVPHPAIPGAIWIPGAGLGAPTPPIDQFFRQRLAAATGNDMQRPLILYCHEKCWLSWNGAKRAIQYGYRNVYWFPDGIEGWRKAKLPTAVVQPEATPATVRPDS
jgi:PQQ-dependent catabolism-associated CXXCW motif protein